MKEFSTQKQYSKVKENAYHKHAETVHFRSELRDHVYLGKKDHVLNPKPKNIKRSAGRLQYKIQQDTNVSDTKAPASPLLGTYRRAKAVKRFFREGKKTYLRQPAGGKQFQAQGQFKTQPEPASTTRAVLQRKTVKRYFNENSKTYFREPAGQRRFQTVNHSKRSKGHRERGTGQDGSKKQKNSNHGQKQTQQKKIRRSFQDKEKVYFTFGDGRSYFRAQPITVQANGHKIIRFPKEQKKKPENIYKVPGLKQYRPTKLQRLRKKINSNKVYRASKLYAQEKTEQKLEEAGEDNVAVRATHRIGQVTNKNLKTFEKLRKKTKKKNIEKFNRKVIKKYSRQELDKTRKKPATEQRTVKLYQKSYMSGRPDRKPDQKQQLKKQLQKKNQIALFHQDQMQLLKRNPLRLIIEELKKAIVRNSLLIGGISGIFLVLLIVTAIMMAATFLVCFMTMMSYPAEHEELDRISAYIEQQDAAYIEMFEHMGDGYPRFTLTYEGTGVVQTNKRHMISYLTAKLLDELTMEKTQETIDWFYPMLYPYESWTVWEQVSSNPDRWVTHLYVVVTCKTVEQVIREQNLLPDESQKEYYKMLNKTGGTYFPPLSTSPFPGTDWSPYITSPYGWRIHPITGERSFHSGVDIGMPEGTEISCVQSGRVVAVGSNSTEGNYITVENETMRTTYMHCSAILAQHGDEVSEGDIIALVGNTGRSTGPHLHLSMWVDGVMVDPMEYVSAE